LKEAGNMPDTDTDHLHLVVLTDWLTRNGFHVERGNNGRWFKRDKVRVVLDDTDVCVYVFDHVGALYWNARLSGTPLDPTTALIASAARMTRS
jgi:hypothetical protein